MLESEDEEFSILLYDELITATRRGTLFKVGDKEYWIPDSMLGETDKQEKTVEVKKWYYDKHFL